MRGKVLDDSTAEKIKAAAREVFVAKGYDGATMQAIADLAGFNKAQVHYYFRNKDALFYMVFKEEMVGFLAANGPILSMPGATLREKLEAWIDVESAFMSTIPALPVFIIAELHRNPEAIIRFFEEVRIPDVVRQLVGNEASSGRATPSTANLKELMAMVISLIIFPIVGRPMLQMLLNADDEGWAEIQARQLSFAKELLDKHLG